MTAAVTGRELGMPSKSTAMEISAICGVFILLALWGIVWDITSGLLTSGIDGIMLVLVCAMMAGIFFLIMMMELTKSGILPTPAFLRPAPKPAAAAKPAAAPAAKAPATGAPAAAPKPSVPAAGAPAAVAPKPAVPAAAATPGAPPTAPRPAAPAPAPSATSAPAKPTATVPAEPPPVPEKK